jgi:hypothetical protein
MQSQQIRPTCTQIVVVHIDLLARMKASFPEWQRFEHEVEACNCGRQLPDGSWYLDTEAGQSVFRSFSSRYVGHLSGEPGVYPLSRHLANFADPKLNSVFVFKVDESCMKLIDNGPLFAPAYKLVDLERIREAKRLEIRLMWTRWPTKRVAEIPARLQNVRTLLSTALPEQFSQTDFQELILERHNNSVLVRPADALLADPVCVASFITSLYREVILPCRVNMTLFQEPGRPVTLLPGSR